MLPARAQQEQSMSGSRKSAAPIRFLAKDFGFEMINECINVERIDERLKEPINIAVKFL